MTYEEKLITIFDRLRPEGDKSKGSSKCGNINCAECPFSKFQYCWDIIDLLMLQEAGDIVAVAKIIDEEEVKKNDF
jgi:hypothetical protein